MSAAADRAEPLLGASTASVADTARAYLPLPFIAFGGPQAHIGIMLDRFVTRKRWLTERLFTELLAISNALPGPASTQLAFTIALIRAGPVAAIIAFLIWSIPGAIVMGSLGYWLGQAGSRPIPPPILQIENGLSCVAVALVAIAARKLGAAVLTDNPARLTATGAACALVLFPAEIWLIPVVLALGGAVRLGVDRRPQLDLEADPPVKPDDVDRVQLSYSRRTGALLMGGTVAAVVLFAWIRSLPALSVYVRVWATFFVVGAIIFGGGPVVVPMLYAYVVGAGWMSSSEFLMGLAVINCMPGPNFNFAAFCGALALQSSPWTSATGAFLGWLGIFLPGLTIKAGILPLWSAHREMRTMEVLFKGFNSVAVGFMFAAVYILWEKAIVASPLGTSLGAYPEFVAITAVSFVLIEYVKAPVPAVLAMAGSGSLLQSWLA